MPGCTRFFGDAWWIPFPPTLVTLEDNSLSVVVSCMLDRSFAMTTARCELCKICRSSKSMYHRIAALMSDGNARYALRCEHWMDWLSCGPMTTCG